MNRKENQVSLEIQQERKSYYFFLNMFTQFVRQIKRKRFHVMRFDLNQEGI
jgi:hypothetical protein